VATLLVRSDPLAVTTGAAGIALIVTLKFGDTAPLPQVLVPFTVITPVAGVFPKVTVIVLPA
jgi:hypothetical protein